VVVGATLGAGYVGLVGGFGYRWMCRTSATAGPVATLALALAGAQATVLSVGLPHLAVASPDALFVVPFGILFAIWRRREKHETAAGWPPPRRGRRPTAERRPDITGRRSRRSGECTDRPATFHRQAECRRGTNPQGTTRIQWVRDTCPAGLRNRPASAGARRTEKAGTRPDQANYMTCQEIGGPRVHQ
jgi:hypothetical protein